MARVIGDVEAEEFLVLLLFLVVEQGEDEAVVFLAVVGFPVFLAAIDEGLGLDSLSSGHGEVDALADFSAQLSGAAGGCLVGRGGDAPVAGKGKDGEHVLVAVGGLVVVLRPFAVAVEEVLLHVALAIGVGVPHFIDGVMLAFEGAFAEVEGHELGGEVGDEGVAHGEDEVAPLVAGEEEVIAQGGLPFVGGGAHGVVGGSALDPDEVPVEVEVVGEVFASAEGGVLDGALGKGR